MAKTPKVPPDAPQGHPEPNGEQQVPAAPPEVDWDDLAKKVKAKIAQHEHTLKRGGLEIGVLILNEAFNGDLSKVKDKNPLKSTSLAGLAKRDEIGVDSTVLGCWVRAADLWQWLEKNGQSVENLSTSHFIALLPLDDVEKKTTLAVEANKGMSVRELRERVQRQGARQPRAGVRKP